jgi:hypothetical protein
MDDTGGLRWSGVVRLRAIDTPTSSTPPGSQKAGHHPAATARAAKYELSMVDSVEECTSWSSDGGVFLVAQ